MNQGRVVIAGAGIGGPVTAMWLQRLGFEVVLLEARPQSVGVEGAFLGLAPNGLNALAPLGLNERITARGHACSAFQFLNAAGHTLGGIDRSGDRSSFGWPLLMIRRHDLHALLNDACRERGLAARTGVRLEGLEARDEEVLVRLSDGSALRAHALIGCDGVRSVTRTLALPRAPAPRFTGLLDFGGFARVAGLPFPPGQNVMVFGRRAFFGAFTTPQGETWWFHNGPPADDALGAEAHRARMLELHRGDPPWVAALIRSTDQLLGPWKIHELAAMPRWSNGRVCLLGDAAHAMSPSAGQGASMAMEDALVLTQCLRDVAEPAHAFELFERLRRPRVDTIFKAAQRTSNHKALSPLGAWFRDRLLPRFLPAAGRAQSEAYAFRLDWDQRVA